jgi:hypothetical protein
MEREETKEALVNRTGVLKIGGNDTGKYLLLIRWWWHLLAQLCSAQVTLQCKKIKGADIGIPPDRGAVSIRIGAGHTVVYTYTVS